MAKFTGESIIDESQVQAKPAVNPALAAALAPQNTATAPRPAPIPLSPQDERSFALSQTNRLAAEKLKIAEEARQQVIRQADEARRLQMESEKSDQKKAKNLENLPTLIARAKSVLKGENIDETGVVSKAPLPTQSLGGSIIDVMGGLVGKTPQGAAQADRLKVIGGAMVMAMPRMEGPQSDADTKLYREMAGKVGDETISIERRLNALDEVEKIYSKYNKTSGWKVVK